MNTQKRYLLYCLVDPSAEGEIRYIGITSENLSKRLGKHVYEAKTGGKNYRCNWIRSLLKENIKPEIHLLDSLPSWEDACKSEIQTIKELREIGYRLVNGTDGGEGSVGFKHTEESKAKLSAAMKGKQTRLGKQHSDETKTKISAAHTGRKHTAEARQNMSAAGKGRKFSEDHRKKISAAHKDKLSPWLFKPIIDQNGAIYPSLKEAARILGLHKSNISEVLRGIRKHAGGFKFQYYQTSNQG